MDQAPAPNKTRPYRGRQDTLLGSQESAEQNRTYPQSQNPFANSKPSQAQDNVGRSRIPRLVNEHNSGLRIPDSCFKNVSSFGDRIESSQLTTRTA
ncbi:hypothetical protein PHISCL_09440 [Aspergillus sclerotialis]|uniref:Uncharacterized protein n=1 Tax=Aspergillus sclerotialis TaxID=2070753 RepID=A0A3A2Z5X9_9EURO|nr:hypothetical protein PHISCL_09440 [Aspergillus sclerotialis]